MVNKRPLPVYYSGQEGKARTQPALSGASSRYRSDAGIFLYDEKMHVPVATHHSSILDRSLPDIFVCSRHRYSYCIALGEGVARVASTVVSFLAAMRNKIVCSRDVIKGIRLVTKTKERQGSS